MPSALAKRPHDGVETTAPAPTLASNSTSAKFHHPYTPYDVQMQFMKTVYDICERGDGHVGILESPTGTGKSLSLICGALTWLREHKRRQFEQTEASLAADPKYADEPDWIVEQMLKQRRKELAGKWERREERLREARRKEKADERTAKRRRTEHTSSKVKEDADEFLLDDEPRNEDRLSWLSADTRARLQKAGLASADTSTEEEEEENDEIKIYYTSRTHSQLTQFISELRRPAFPSSVPESVSTTQEEVIKHIPLSSRQRLCINPSVNRLGSVAAINDRCAELQKPAKSKDSGTEKKCKFALNPDNRAETHQFRDTALATVPDIEDLYRLGTSLQVCPYYASRTAVPGAEIVSLPYPLLLQKEARDALGINLNSKNSIVIIDEAHNIMDAVASVHAAGIRLSELRRARALLGVYVKKFGKRLGQKSRLMVGQLGIVIAALCEWAMNTSKDSKKDGIVDPTALLKYKGADQINMFTLVKYIQESKLAYKVEGYAALIEEELQVDKKGPTEVKPPVLHALSSFLLALTNLSSEGRIFFEVDTEKERDVRLSYLLLSPTHAFASIASSARAVILAGGTMSPFADYKTHLFPGLLPSKLTTLSCGHVIPASNLCVVTLASVGIDKTKNVYDFSFGHRSDSTVVHNLGMAILNVCTVVPDGVVVFFPSYAYLEEVASKWVQSGIFGRIESKKTVLRESKGCSSDEVLAAYSAAVDSNRGALLLSVVGGKMSEGINFADRLGRCVVIVGLPFPNLHSADWKARMEYIEAAATTAATQSLPSASPTASSSTSPSKTSLTATSSTSLIKTAPPSTSMTSSSSAGKDAAREYYENACMRAVNQSIGRAIRHQNDYASIILLDRRFGSERIRSKLPGWIRAGMSSSAAERQDLGGMMQSVGTFFRSKK